MTQPPAPTGAMSGDFVVLRFRENGGAAYEMDLTKAPKNRDDVIKMLGNVTASLSQLADYANARLRAEDQKDVAMMHWLASAPTGKAN